MCFLTHNSTGIEVDKYFGHTNTLISRLKQYARFFSMVYYIYSIYIKVCRMSVQISCMLYIVWDFRQILFLLQMFPYGHCHSKQVFNISSSITPYASPARLFYPNIVTYVQKVNITMTKKQTPHFKQPEKSRKKQKQQRVLFHFFT